MNTHIEQALYNFRTNGVRYARAERYYDGDHDLAFASAKFENTFGSLFREFALNLCPAVCDAMRDRLKVEGFTILSEPPASAGGQFRKLPNSPTAHAVHSDAIWHRNRMDARSGEVHKEALKNGDAYVIVWPDRAGNAAIFPHAASSCTVEYDEEEPGKIVWAAKFWRTKDKHTRLNLFYPDRIERYITSKPHEGMLPDSRDLIPFPGLATKVVQLELVPTGRRLHNNQSVIQNPYGIVPVFHFANNASIGAFGRSELEDAIPLQDGMNKSVLDMLVAMEFSAYRQRWAAGIEIEYDTEGNVIAPFKAGIDHLWITGNEGARFGDFETANLEQFLKVKDGFRIDIASVTGTPLYYLLPQGRGFTSGEAMRRAESRFIAKIRDRQVSFGQVWADVMQFALKIEGHSVVMLTTRWDDAARLTEKELLENILLKKEIGLSSEHALTEAGY